MTERHEKLIRAIELVQRLSGSRTGLTITELAEGMECSRRTAERVLKAVGQACDGLEAIPGDGGEKRWRMGPSFLSRTLKLSAAEMSEMELAAARLESEGQGERAELLRGAGRKLRALAEPRALHAAELDAEALLAAEGLATRPGPRMRVGGALIGRLRQAILARRVLRVRYRGKDGAEAERLLEPCGLLYGQRPYLLAAVPGKADAAVWRLDRLLEVEVTAQPCAPRFDMAALTAGNFGVWREPPMDVVLRFAPGAAGEAANWVFHASQAAAPQPDGTLLVRFRAGGLEEMAFHLATWGEAVEVLEPPALGARLAALGEALLRRHGTGTDVATPHASPRGQEEAA